MERIQPLTTRMVKGMKELLCEESLCRLDIASLERCQLRRDLILAYNTFHDRLDMPQAEFSEALAERDL